MKSFKEYFAEGDGSRRPLEENHLADLPLSGDFPYVRPKNCHTAAARVKASPGEVYVDKKGLRWAFDAGHGGNHWDVSDPRIRARNRYIRVNPQGSILEVVAPSDGEKTTLLLEMGVDSSTIAELLIEG